MYRSSNITHSIKYFCESQWPRYVYTTESKTHGNTNVSGGFWQLEKKQSSPPIIHISDLWAELPLWKYIFKIHEIIFQATQSVCVPRGGYILFSVLVSEYKPLDKGNWVELSYSRRSMALMKPENAWCYSLLCPYSSTVLARYYFSTVCVFTQKSWSTQISNAFP